MAWMLAGLMGHLADVTIRGGIVSAFFVWVGFVLDHDDHEPGLSWYEADRDSHRCRTLACHARRYGRNYRSVWSLED
jgi:hypothetical protein